jgi:hypothetical protein
LGSILAGTAVIPTRGRLIQGNEMSSPYGQQKFRSLTYPLSFEYQNQVDDSSVRQAAAVAVFLLERFRSGEIMPSQIKYDIISNVSAIEFTLRIFTTGA